MLPWREKGHGELPIWGLVKRTRGSATPSGHRIIGHARICASTAARRSTEALDETRGAHASTDAHGDERVATGAALELRERGGDELRARAPERVAQRDRAAV